MSDPKPLTAEELARLRAVAESAEGRDVPDSATVGRWKNSGRRTITPDSMSRSGMRVTAISMSHPGGPWEAVFCYLDRHAAHIAAFDPPTVLLLLDMVERLQQERDQLSADFDVLGRAYNEMGAAAVWAVATEREAVIRDQERIAQLERCVSFFASVIKCGEPWTEECERALATARGDQ